MENSNEKSIEQLRESLLAGGFGSEATADASDAQADESIDMEARLNDFIAMFGSKEKTALKGYNWKVYVPNSIADNPDFKGDLFGIVRDESESVYIFDYEKYKQEKYRIGCLADTHEDPCTYRVKASFADGALRVSVCVTSGELCFDKNFVEAAKIHTYGNVTKLFSRNTGLLESDAMLTKRAVLVGCGSVGSFVAMELARSGVGKFVLCDTDTLEMHNICRHQCGFDDLGRYKVDAVKDKILNINPAAEVITYRSIIQDVPEEDWNALLGRDTIIIGGGDNRGSADFACKMAIRTDSSFVSTGCWTRAFAGEIFYWTSGRDLSCYSCAFGELIDNDRPESHAHYFGSDTEMQSLSFEPGIAADIDFVTIIATKVALDLLNRDNPNYTPRVINYLKQYTWVCNTNSEKIGGERAGIFAHPLQITYSLKVKKDPNCPHCNGK